MNYKEKVLNFYPRAFLNKGRVIQMESNKFFIYNVWNGPFEFLGSGFSPNRAWKNVWDNIQQKMVERLAE